MIEIKRRDSGEILMRVDVETLEGVSLRNANLLAANLSRVNLSNADLTGAELSHADLSYADLTEAKLIHADLSGAKLVNVNLAKSIMTGARLFSANLSGANLLHVDLSDSDLTRAKLTRAIMCRANLVMAYMRDVDLTDADLRGANISRVILSGADLSGATLSGADLYSANLSKTNLSNANLSHVNLFGADLSSTNMTGAELPGALLFQSIFALCDTLHEASGLDEIEHHGPSALDQHTLRASVCKLSSKFLLGVGYTTSEIDYLQNKYVDGPSKYFSCFLSHTSKDGAFADKLRKDLIANQVRTWHYKYDMRGGEYMRPQLNNALEKQDKTIVVCSKHSLANENVIDEILESMRLERVAGVKKLFPINLDGFIFSPAMNELVNNLPDLAKREEWWKHLPYYHIPDWSGWLDGNEYQRELEKLLRDLETPVVG